MKIAFCFLTIDNLNQADLWEKFFDQSPAASHTIYSHPKHPDEVSDAILKDSVVPNRLQTRHGHVSLVEASMALFSHAYNDDSDNEFFVLLSESTAPIVPFSRLYQELSCYRGKSLFSYYLPPTDSEHYQRIHTLVDKHRFENSFFQHDQWLVLHRKHLRLLMETPCYTMFDQMFAADEHYFLNVMTSLLKVPMDEVINRKTTFVNWQEKQVKLLKHPVTGEIITRTVHPKNYEQITDEDILLARDKGCWFIRKLSPSCQTQLLRAYIE